MGQPSNGSSFQSNQPSRMNHVVTNRQGVQYQPAAKNRCARMPCHFLLQLLIRGELPNYVALSTVSLALTRGTQCPEAQFTVPWIGKNKLRVGAEKVSFMGPTLFIIASRGLGE